MMLFFAWVKRSAVQLSIAFGPLILVGLPLIQGRVLIWGTPVMQFVPWWLEACRQLAQGQLPLWNSLNGMGAPLAANYQSAFFYPPNWFLVPLGFMSGAQGIAVGITALAMLHLIWAGWGLAALLYRCGASRLAQTIGGLAFTLGGYLVARLEFYSIVCTAAWLPWVVYAASILAAPVKALIPTPRFRFSIRLAFSIGMMLLAGHAQLSWYGILFAGAWVLAGSLRGSLKGFFWPVLSLAAAGLAGVLLAAVQLAPTAEYLLQSQRSSEYGYTAAMTYSFWPWRLITLLAPDFFGNPGLGDYWGYASYWEDAIYIGILPLFLAISTLAGAIRKPKTDEWSGRWLKGFLWIVVLISFVLALGKNTLVYPFLYRYVPTFNMFQAPARYLIWAVFALSVLAAVGAERWNCPQGRGLYWLRLGTAGAFAVTLGAGLAWLNLRDVQATFIRATALAGLWALGAGSLTLLQPAFKRWGKTSAWAVLVVIWVSADLLAAGWWLNPMVKSSFYQGREPAVSALKADLAERRVFMPARVEFLLKFRRFFRASNYRPVGEWRDLRAVLLPNTNLLDGVAAVNNFDPLLPARYARWTAALELLSAEERSNWLRLAGVGAVAQIDLSQPGGVRFDRLETPRRYPIHACAEWIPGGEEGLEKFSLAAQNSARIFLEGVSVQPSCQPEILGWAKPTVTRPGNMVFQTAASSPGWLLVDESWYPGWGASVDGFPTAVLRANYLFMAIYVPAGGHEIRLQYRSVPFTIGAIMSILVVVLFSILAFRHHRNSLSGSRAGPV